VFEIKIVGETKAFQTKNGVTANRADEGVAPLHQFLRKHVLAVQRSMDFPLAMADSKCDGPEERGGGGLFVDLEEKGLGYRLDHQGVIDGTVPKGRQPQGALCAPCLGHPRFRFDRGVRGMAGFGFGARSAPYESALCRSRPKR